MDIFIKDSILNTGHFLMNKIKWKSFNYVQLCSQKLQFWAHPTAPEPPSVSSDRHEFLLFTTTHLQKRERKNEQQQQIYLEELIFF